MEPIVHSLRRFGISLFWGGKREADVYPYGAHSAPDEEKAANDTQALTR